MKRILNLLFIFAMFFVVLTSCEKEVTTEDMSQITYYVTIDLDGPQSLTIPMGQGYEEPGYTAMEEDTDVTDEVEITSDVDADNPGVYSVVYSAVNQDGFSASVSRTVIVYDPNAPDTDISGTYDGAREGVGGGPITIEKLAPGIFLVSDMFGGSYEYAFGYGSAYRLRTYIMLNEDNTIESLSNSSPWGPWLILNAVYDPVNEVITHTVDQGGFQFNVTLKKQ